jgi:hypothetical protein
MAHVAKKVIILERLSGRARVIGPFDNTDQARDYANAHLGVGSSWLQAGDVWRIGDLEAPEETPKGDAA